MKSRASFFNCAVLRKNLQRCFPLIAIYTIIWAVAMPLSFLNRQSYYLRDDRIRYLFRDILEYGQNLGSVAAITYALALTMVIFSYLYNARSANMIHAFPIRREGLFVTNYVSGLVAFFGPNLLILLTSMLALHGRCSDALMQWFLMIGLQFMFFYGFAVLLAQLTGHIVALPIFYAILNFVVVVLQLILSYMLPNWVYGMPNQITYSATAFSPMVHILAETSCKYTGETAAYYNAWDYLWILFAVGIVFAVVAFLLYRSRRIESAGDAIAVPKLRPVFKYCFSFGCAIILGAAIIAVLNLNLRFGRHVAATICMIVGAFIGYFGSEMALKKKINVFTRGWIGFGIVCVVIIAVPLLCKFNAFGYSTYQPNRDEIVGVNFDYVCNTDDFVRDEHTIDTVLALHRELIENPPLYEDDLTDPALTSGNRTFQVCYKLQDGTIVLREYEFFITDNEWHLNYPLTERVEDLMNLPTLVQLHYCPQVKLTVNNIVNASLEFYGVDGLENNYFDLMPQDVLYVYEHAILPDILAGDLFHTDYTFKVEDYEKYNTTTEATSVQIEKYEAEPHFYLSFNVVTTDGYHEYFYFNIHQDAKRSFTALKNLALQYEAMKSAEQE